MTLHDFLAQNHRFGWGGQGVAHYADPEGGIFNDCITFLATWVQDQTGVDVARAFRGAYNDKAGAEAIIAAHGGLVPLVERQLSEVSARRVQTPAPGDIGVIVAPGGTSEQTQIGAICFGPVWAFITPGRVVAKQAKCLAAWSVPTCA
jgi:hypothetical protein